ncbi:MAG: lactonase family protein [Acidobacteriia bacterium]|nr:lactonase family protein [Terriglobia bacterium]
MTPKFRALCLVPVFVAALFLSGCGKHTCPTTSLGSSGSGGGKGGINTGGSLCGSGNLPGTAAALVYYNNVTNVAAGSISNAGSFSQILGPTFPSMASGANDDVTIVNQEFLYYPFFDIQAVQGFVIDRNSGAVAEMAGSPFFLQSPAEADAVVSDPQGRFLFVGGEGNGSLSVFTIDPTTGVPTEISGSPYTSFGLSFADSMAVDGTGNFLYVAQGDPSLPVAVFSIDQNTGALSAAGQFALGVAQLHADASGQFLLGVPQIQDLFGFAAETSISVFSLDVTGTPTAVAGSPFPTVAAPFDFAISPNSNFVYTTGNDPLSGTLSPVEGFQLDQNTGTLTPLSGSPFSSLAVTPNQCKFDQSGEILLCTESTAGSFSVLTANPTTGDLTHTGTDTVNLKTFPFAITD